MTSSPKTPAVVFDFGNVLVHGPQPETMTAMASLAGLDPAGFRTRYAHFRPAHDHGALDEHSYWREVAGGKVDETVISGLIELDIYAWCVPNMAAMRWIAQLAAAGYQLAILSNMPVYAAGRYETMCDWLEFFPVRIFSGRIGVCKPEPGIYEELLRQIGRPAEEILFIDDLEPNVQGARGFGISAELYHSTGGAGGFRSIAARYGLPLPG